MSVKGVRSHGEGGLSRADILRTKGGLQMRTSALFVAQKSGFFVIYGVSARTGGSSQCGHFSDKGGVCQFFYNFVRTSFIDGPYNTC